MKKTNVLEMINNHKKEKFQERKDNTSSQSKIQYISEKETTKQLKGWGTKNNMKQELKER